MAATTKPHSKRHKATAIRQSVSIPAPLAIEVRRVARERHLTVSRALVTLAERGVRAEQEARDYHLNLEPNRIKAIASQKRGTGTGPVPLAVNQHLNFRWEATN